MGEFVTLLGSCRQWSIRSYYSTSDIQDEITFPHYSKEVLQEIQYLKYRNLTKEETRYCFRSSILSNCKREIDDTLYNKLKEQFDNTSFFLIEIATRVAYKWKNLYLHHIAVDPKYELPDIDEIEVYDLTDEEIEEDLKKIKEELYPKKILVISHFATYNRGKRYDLIVSLEEICKKLDIPFFNQSLLIEKYGMDTIKKEDIMAHFTDYGNNCMRELLYNKMKEINEGNK
jgi:hypothetical protein